MLKTYIFFLCISSIFSVDVPTDEDLDAVKITELFNDFVEEYGKVYPAPSDLTNALEAFGANLLKIQFLNKKFAKSNLEFGVNQYSDLTDAAFGEKVANLEVEENVEPGAVHDGSADDHDFLDWRGRKNTVGKIRDQELSGCGWAFALSSAVQSSNSFATFRSSQPDEKLICECSNAKNLQKGFEWVKEFGVPLESSNNSCEEWSDSIKIGRFTLTRGASGPELQKALRGHGPLVAVIKVGSDLRHYKSGVFNGTDCENIETFIGWHAVSIVGFATFRGAPEWMVKNSWGEKFGEQGYMYIARGYDLCGIESTAVYHVEIY